jgi:hypothetical protein
LIKRPLGVQLYAQLPGQRRFFPEILEELGQIEIFRLQINRHLSVRRDERPFAPEIAPGKRERGVGAGVFRRPLVDLDPADLERRILRLQDGLENQLVARQIDDRTCNSCGV